VQYEVAHFPDVSFVSAIIVAGSARSREHGDGTRGDDSVSGHTGVTKRKARSADCRPELNPYTLEN
jgi:hypothetical protein